MDPMELTKPLQFNVTLILDLLQAHRSIGIHRQLSEHVEIKRLAEKRQKSLAEKQKNACKIGFQLYRCVIRAVLRDHRALGPALERGPLIKCVRKKLREKLTSLTIAQA